jgi:hypothetical protein
MNLHNIVNGSISAINPRVPGTYNQSTGYTTNPDGSRTPSYAQPVTIKIQLQALAFRDLQQLDALNIQGCKHAMYLYGDVEGIDRAAGRGGDTIVLDDGTTWLVTQVLENWNTTAGWVKVAVTKQL